MDYQDPFEGGLQPTLQPYNKTDQTDNAQGTDGNTNPNAPQEGKPKRRIAMRMVALGLCCALLGGLGGGFAVHFFGGGGTSLQIGERTPIALNTVSSDGRKQMTVPEVYANYIDSCVGISVDIVTKNYFGQPVTAAAAGSGFVISEDGYIMTNYHVIEGASKIKVTFVDNTSYDAKLVGGDKDNDIAIIKVEAKDLKPVVIGDSSKMYVGETVVTIGNPLGELTFSLSDGVISALERPITVSAGKTMKMIQTNCTINSGNSGGPLFNLYGEVIGIVSAKYSSGGTPMGSEATIEGLGFAIPISNVKDMMSDIISKGYVSGKPFLGVSVGDVNPAAQAYGVPSGAALIYVTPELAAARAGLREGDIITKVNETKIDSRDVFIETIGGYKAGDTVTMQVYRAGEALEVSVELSEQNNDTVKRNEDYTNKREEEKDQQEQEQQQQQSDGSFPFSFPFF